MLRYCNFVPVYISYGNILHSHIYPYQDQDECCQPRPQRDKRKAQIFLSLSDYQLAEKMILVFSFYEREINGQKQI